MHTWSRVLALSSLGFLGALFLAPERGTAALAPEPGA